MESVLLLLAVSSVGLVASTRSDTAALEQHFLKTLGMNRIPDTSEQKVEVR